MDDRIGVTAETVRELVAMQFPQWAALPVMPVTPGGWDNRTFRLGETMSVRLPSAARYVAQVDKEQRWLPELALQLPLAIPEPLARGAPGAGYPFTWSVRRWLPGEPASLTRIDDMPRVARDLAGFLAALQAIEAGDGPPAGAHNFHRGGRLAVYDEETRRAVAELGDAVDRARVLALWEDALASAWQGPPVWVHGDIAAGNLLSEQGRLCAVIDFGSAGVGDPACDLVIAWTFLHGDAREAFRNALPLDEDTWTRARGWALWKAVITAARKDIGAGERAAALRVIDEVVSEYSGPRHPND